MDRLSTAIRFLPGGTVNPNLVDLSAEFRARDNAAFLAEVTRRLGALREDAGLRDWFPAGAEACVGLSGAYGIIGHLIRHAQALIRVDAMPSYWSHSFLFSTPTSADEKLNRDKRRSAWVWESTLEPAGPFNHFIERNGVGARRFADFAYPSFHLLREHCVPNMAVVAIGLTEEERTRVLDRATDPNVDQLAYDLGALLGTWYAFLTDRARNPNPLATGNALYCSAYVQLAYDAAGIDLAPGAHERNTAPEHLWQFAKYLHRSQPASLPNGKSVDRPIYAWYVVRDKTASITPLFEPRGVKGIGVREVGPTNDYELPTDLRSAIAKIDGLL